MGTIQKSRDQTFLDSYTVLATHLSRGLSHSHINWLIGPRLSFVPFRQHWGAGGCWECSHCSKYALLKKLNQTIAKYEHFFSICLCDSIQTKIRNSHLHLCVSPQHMTQAWEPAPTGVDKKKKQQHYKCFKFYRQPREHKTEGSCNKSLTWWLQTQYNFPLGE